MQAFYPPVDTTVRWAIPPQVYFEQVNEGDAIPAVDFNLTVQRMIMFVGATRNFPGLHHNDRIAQANGATGIFLQNNSCLMLWERVVSDWMGIFGRVRSATFRITEFHLAGDTIHVGGTIHKKWQENGLNLVDLAMESKTPRRVGMTGTVTVALPSLKYPSTTPMWDRDGKATIVCQ
ncbi:MAG: acyl dehydratase [Dehalococcoidia bacterium]|nr:acyl dehydratase [Dehalococcoidia bacterium]